MEPLSLVYNLLAAMVLGGLIGLERQFTGHAAGIRTCALVCMGASLFTAFPFCILGGDVTRMAAQIISGVGFLGSGIIFKDGSNVRGINTAATIWCTAGVGIFAGAGLYIPAAISAACLFLGNVMFRLLTERNKLWGHFDDSGHIFVLRVLCQREQANMVREKMIAILSSPKLYLLEVHACDTEDSQIKFEARYIYDGRDYIARNENITNEISGMLGVKKTGWMFKE